jgi:hypothetical protein
MLATGACPRRDGAGIVLIFQIITRRRSRQLPRSGEGLERGRPALVIPHIFSGLSFIFTLIPCIVVVACSVWIGTTPEVLNIDNPVQAERNTGVQCTNSHEPRRGSTIPIVFNARTSNNLMCVINAPKIARWS